MRIDGTSGVSNSTKVKKKEKSGAKGDFSSLLTQTDESSESTSAQQAHSVASVSSAGLLTPVTEEQKQFGTNQENVDFGKELIQEMKELRDMILLGSVSYSTLLNIEKRLNEIPLAPEDEKLKSIVEDIKVRASVEIEKIRKHFNNQT